MNNLLQAMKLFLIYLFGIMIGLSIIAICEGAELNFKGNYYEKDGCIYLEGNLTETEKKQDLALYKERMKERATQVQTELQRQHEIELTKINAKALENYLIAQSLDYSKIAEAIASQGDIVNSTWIGDISSSSNNKIGNISAINKNNNTTRSTATNTNKPTTSITNNVKPQFTNENDLQTTNTNYNLHYELK